MKMNLEELYLMIIHRTRDDPCDRGYVRDYDHADELLEESSADECSPRQHQDTE